MSITLKTDGQDMNNSQSGNDTREISIEAWNMVFGRAVFAYIELPESWITGYQINDPFVTNRLLYNNLVWVGIGEVECIISRERGQDTYPSLDFKLRIVVNLQKDGPIAPSPDDLFLQHEEKGHEVIEFGKLKAGNHQGSYILWTKSHKRFIIFGENRPSTRLVGYIPCSETTRLLTLTWTSPESNLIINHSSNLIESFNTVLCHGHETDQ